MYKPKEHFYGAQEVLHERTEQTATYVPKAHVQFLEQAGVRVIPIDYRLSTEERHKLYDQLNGVYLPGDSHQTITDDAYKLAFVDTLHYQETQVFDQQEHFPLFLMGNSLQTLVRARSSHSGNLKPMHSMKHSNFPLRMVSQPEDTYFFAEMTRDERQAMFNTAHFFNRQASGISMGQLENDDVLNRNLQPIAVYQTHGGEVADDDFVAIMEGKKVPLYAFTYGLEMVQFYFEDSRLNNDETQLDHSIIARKHAQSVASLIADEARLSSHSFEHEEDIFERLIRHEKVS